MSSASFKISYCGPSLESGAMDVRELAPALLAFGSLLEESNRVLNGNATTVSVRVKRFEDGSFGISFEVVQNLTDQLIGLLTGKPVTAAVNLIAILGLVYGSGITLWKLLKRSKGRRPKKATKLEDGNIEINFEEDSVTVSDEVFQLYRDMNVRKYIYEALKPLDKQGIDVVKILLDGALVESASKTELPYFLTPDIEDEVIAEDERIAVFSIHSLSFKDDNKWRLSDGTNAFFVTIKDSEFLRKVNENLVYFSKGDLLKVKLRVRTWTVMDGIKTEYEAIEIIDHKSAAKQLSLPFE
jgi:hypothetical protein